MASTTPCDGMWLSIKSSTDDFDENLFTVSTYGQYSGNNDIRENDIVDMLDYLFLEIAPTKELQKAYPYLSLIDCWGHTFLDARAVVSEIEKMVEFAKTSNNAAMVTKLSKIIGYCEQANEESHQILQFDGM